MKRYDRDEFVDCVARYSITETAVAPPIILQLLALPQAKKSLVSIRFIWCGGAPLLASVQNRMSHCLHSDAIIAQVWGMTEIGVSFTPLWRMRNLLS